MGKVWSAVTSQRKRQGWSGQCSRASFTGIAAFLLEFFVQNCIMQWDRIMPSLSQSPWLCFPIEEEKAHQRENLHPVRCYREQLSKNIQKTLLKQLLGLWFQYIYVEAQMLLHGFYTDAYPEILMSPWGLDKSYLRSEEFLMRFFWGFFPFLCLWNNGIIITAVMTSYFYSQWCNILNLACRAIVLLL